MASSAGELLRAVRRGSLSGLVRIALQVCAEFCTFPCSRDALLEDMKSHYGLSFDMLKEASVLEGEDVFVHIGTNGIETA